MILINVLIAVILALACLRDERVLLISITFRTKELSQNAHQQVSIVSAFLSHGISSTAVIYTDNQIALIRLLNV